MNWGRLFCSGLHGTNGLKVAMLLWDVRETQLPPGGRQHALMGHWAELRQCYVARVFC